MSHGIIRCKICHGVVAQCRCIDHDDNVSWIDNCEFCLKGPKIEKVTFPEHCIALADAASDGPWEETWKDIPGLEGRYQVSDYGNVKSRLKKGNHKSKCNTKYRLLKKVLTRGRYTVSVPLGRNGNYQHKRISTIVASAFLGPRPPNFDVAHLNGDCSDDRLINLKYCSRKENESHKKLHGTDGSGSRNSQAKLQEWQVDEIRYLSSKSIPQSKIANLFDIHVHLVSEVVSGRNWKNRTSRTLMPELATRLKTSIGIISALLETFECREDEDCDHCVALQAILDLERMPGGEG